MDFRYRPGARQAFDIHDSVAAPLDGAEYAVEWIGGTVTNLRASSTFSEAYGINDAGLMVGESVGLTVPEPSTLAMSLLGLAGLAGLALAGYCRAKAGHAKANRHGVQPRPSLRAGAMSFDRHGGA